MWCHQNPPPVLYIVAACCVLEIVFCGIILRYVAYTEIDWRAYMQEVEGWWIHGEHDYRLLRGDTGPLVYPAGFLYLFTLLRSYTDEGTNIQSAQILFAIAYILQQGIVVWISIQVWTVTLKRRVIAPPSKTSSEKSAISNATGMTRMLGFDTNKSSTWWGVAIAMLCLSKRLHSIFVLRLFNDGMAMLIFYVSVLFFMKNQWKWGCLIFSLAVSIKMNILLFAPGLLLLLLQSQKSVQETLFCLGICAASQILIGLPFLCTFPISYLKKAFELDRVFFYRWTVNWKLLPENIFLSKQFAITLLTLHIGTLVYFTISWLKAAKQQTQKRIFFGRRLAPDYVLYTLMLSNYVGITFARTLHYQFYSWFFHAIPLLLWISPTYPVPLRIILWAAMEYAFNVYPATAVSSAILQVVNCAVLLTIRSPQELGIQILEDDRLSENLDQKDK